MFVYRFCWCYEFIFCCCCRGVVGKFSSVGYIKVDVDDDEDEIGDWVF